MSKGNTSDSVRAPEVTDADVVDQLFFYLDAFHAQARPELFQAPIGKPRGDGFLRSVLDDPQQKILIGLLDEEVVGFAHVVIKHTPASPFKVDRHFGEIDAVAVLPKAQGHGLGRKLITAATEWLTSNDINDHQIAVHAFNERARRLYEQLNFTPSFTMLRRTDS